MLMKFSQKNLDGTFNLGSVVKIGKTVDCNSTGMGAKPIRASMIALDTNEIEIHHYIPIEEWLDRNFRSELDKQYWRFLQAKSENIQLIPCLNYFQ